jgi:hypothetical protein
LAWWQKKPPEFSLLSPGLKLQPNSELENARGVYLGVNLAIECIWGGSNHRAWVAELNAVEEVIGFGSQFDGDRFLYLRNRLCISAYWLYFEGWHGYGVNTYTSLISTVKNIFSFQLVL